MLVAAATGRRVVKLLGPTERPAISGAVVQLMREYTGRGPTKARTYINDALIAAVERHSGRSVFAFLSDNHIDPDVAVESFVLVPHA